MLEYLLHCMHFTRNTTPDAYHEYNMSKANLKPLDPDILCQGAGDFMAQDSEVGSQKRGGGGGGKQIAFFWEVLSLSCTLYLYNTTLFCSAGGGDHTMPPPPTHTLFLRLGRHPPPPRSDIIAGLHPQSARHRFLPLDSRMESTLCLG